MSVDESSLCNEPKGGCISINCVSAARRYERKIKPSIRIRAIPRKHLALTGTGLVAFDLSRGTSETFFTRNIHLLHQIQSNLS